MPGDDQEVKLRFSADGVDQLLNDISKVDQALGRVNQAAEGRTVAPGASPSIITPAGAKAYGYADNVANYSMPVGTGWENHPSRVPGQSQSPLVQFQAPYTVQPVSGGGAPMPAAPGSNPQGAPAPPHPSTVNYGTPSAPPPGYQPLSSGIYAPAGYRAPVGGGGGGAPAEPHPSTQPTLQGVGYMGPTDAQSLRAYQMRLGEESAMLRQAMLRTSAGSQGYKDLASDLQAVSTRSRLVAQVIQDSGETGEPNWMQSILGMAAYQQFGRVNKWTRPENLAMSAFGYAAAQPFVQAASPYFQLAAMRAGGQYIAPEMENAMIANAMLSGGGMLGGGIMGGLIGAGIGAVVTGGPGAIPGAMIGLGFGSAIGGAGAQGMAGIITARAQLQQTLRVGTEQYALQGGYGAPQQSYTDVPRWMQMLAPFSPILPWVAEKFGYGAQSNVMVPGIEGFAKQSGIPTQEYWKGYEAWLGMRPDLVGSGQFKYDLADMGGRLTPATFAAMNQQMARGMQEPYMWGMLRRTIYDEGRPPTADDARIAAWMHAAAGNMPAMFGAIGFGALTGREADSIRNLGVAQRESQLTQQITGMGAPMAQAEAELVRVRGGSARQIGSALREAGDDLEAQIGDLENQITRIRRVQSMSPRDARGLEPMRRQLEMSVRQARAQLFNMTVREPAMLAYGEDVARERRDISLAGLFIRGEELSGKAFPEYQGAYGRMAAHWGEMAERERKMLANPWLTPTERAEHEGLYRQARFQQEYGVPAERTARAISWTQTYHGSRMGAMEAEKGAYSTMVGAPSGIYERELSVVREIVALRQNLEEQERRGVMSADQRLRIQTQIAELTAREATARYQAVRAYVDNVAQAHGTQAGIFGTMAGRWQARGAGGEQVGGLVREQVAELQSQALVHLQWANDPRVSEPERRQYRLMAESEMAQVNSARLGMIDSPFSAHQRDTERQASFDIFRLTSSFSERGSVRGAFRQQMEAGMSRIGAIRQRAEELGPNISPAEAERLNEQLDAARRMVIGSQVALQQGWMERLVGTVSGMPESFNLVGAEFNYSNAVMRHGVEQRAFGATAGQRRGFRNQSLWASAYGGAGRLGRRSFLSTALMGVGSAGWEDPSDWWAVPELDTADILGNMSSVKGKLPGVPDAIPNEVMAGIPGLPRVPMPTVDRAAGGVPLFGDVRMTVEVLIKNPEGQTVGQAHSESVRRVGETHNVMVRPTVNGSVQGPT